MSTATQPRRQPRAAPTAAPATTVIIPAYNEEEGIAAVLRELMSVLDDRYEVLVVDDGSDDSTYQAASSFPCRIVRHETRRGKGKAMKTGLRAAAGRNAVFIDADGSYPAEAIPRIARALDEYDVVVASRVAGTRNSPLLNRIGNAIFRQSIRYLHGFRAHDPLSGLYGLRKAHLLRMNLSSSGFGIETEIAIKGAHMGLRMLDIPIEYRPRIGEAKLNGLKDGLLILFTILALLPRRRPWWCAVPVGLLLSLAGVFAFLVQPIAAWRTLVP